jgi:hypothetical protein
MPVKGRETLTRFPFSHLRSGLSSSFFALSGGKYDSISSPRMPALGKKGTLHLSGMIIQHG